MASKSDPYQTILSLLFELNLDNIPTEVVDRLWKGEEALETDSELILTNVFDNNFRKNTKNVISKLVKQIISIQQSNKGLQTQESLWEHLSERNFPQRTFLVWMWQVIQCSRPTPSSPPSCPPEIGFDICRFYLILLTQSSHSTAFHPVSFRNILNLIKSWKAEKDLSEAKMSKRKTKASKGKGGPQSKKTKTLHKAVSRKAAPVEDEDQDEESMEDQFPESNADEEEEETSLDKQNTNLPLLSITTETLTSLLGDLRSVLEIVPLELYSEPKSHLIEILAELTRFHSSTQSKGATNSISQASFDILLMLIDHKHGSKDQTLTVIMKNLLPNVLMSYGGLLTSPTVPKHVLNIKNHTLEFIRKVMEADDVPWEPIHALMQHLCIQIPEKADWRNHSCESSLFLYTHLPVSQRPRYVKFLQRISKNAKVNTIQELLTVKSNLRLLAVEIACILITEIESRNLASENLDENAGSSFIACRPLIEILLNRSSDKIASVRAKAIQSLATILQDAISNEPLKEGTLVAAGLTYSALFQLDKTVITSPEKQSNTNQDNVDLNNILCMFRRRAEDEKCGVKKSALQAIESIGHFGSQLLLTSQDLRLFQQRCQDNSVLIRKQALNSLTALYELYPSNPVLTQVWVHSIFPLVLDPETSVQDRSLDILYQLIIEKIISCTRDEKDTSVWQLLSSLDDSEMLRLFQRVCSALGKQNRLKPSLINALQKCIQMNKPEQTVGVWIVLSEVAPFCASHIDYKLIIQSWNAIHSLTTEEVVQQQQRTLQVIDSVASKIPASLAKDLSDSMLARLKEFNTAPALIQSLVNTLLQLSRALASSPSEQQHLIKSWGEELLTICDNRLAAYVLPLAGIPEPLMSNLDTSHLQDTMSWVPHVPPISSVEEDAEKVQRYLFTVGEVAQACHLPIPGRLITVVQALIAPMSLNDNAGTFPAPVRACAFVALGKMCLEDEKLAKKCVPAFAKELETSVSPIVRNNVMVIMCDLCIKYTAIVDPYVSNLAGCLKDSNELVRRQTLMCLTRLLSEDFVKWKGSLFYRFVVALVDESTQIQQSANVFFIALLKSKNPLMFFTHFIELMFYLNDYKQHPVYNQFPQTEKDRETFCLSGKSNRKKRMTIYKTFLMQMTEEQKFQTTAKLCQEILAAVIDGGIPYNESAELMEDTLGVLACKEIKVNTSAKRAAADDEEEEALAAAKEKILSKIVKKNVLENIIPIIIELKRFFEKHRSPLQKTLMDYLKDLLKDNKDEIEDILVADKQLAKEIQYDLKQFSAQEKQKRIQAQTVSPLPNPQQPVPSPRALTPKPGRPVTPTAVMEQLVEKDKNFSVPRLKGTPTPLRTRPATSSNNRLHPNDAISPPNQMTSPFKSPLPLSPRNVPRINEIILPSPSNTPSKTKWQVHLQPIPLALDENQIEEDLSAGGKRKSLTVRKVQEEEAPTAPKRRSARQKKK